MGGHTSVPRGTTRYLCLRTFHGVIHEVLTNSLLNTATMEFANWCMSMKKELKVNSLLVLVTKSFL